MTTSTIRRSGRRRTFTPSRPDLAQRIFGASLLALGGLLAGVADDAGSTLNVTAGAAAAPQPQALSVVADVADCTPSVDGTARYFVSVRSSAGVDIMNATGRLVGTGSENLGQVVNMFNGDLESQADDGSPRAGCVPRPNDGRANDLGTPFVPAAPGTYTWSLRVLVAGSLPPPAIDLSPFVDGTVCPLGDDRGCLISLGTVVVTGASQPSTSGGSGGSITPSPTRFPLSTPVASPTVTASPTLAPSPAPSQSPTSVSPTATSLPAAVPEPLDGAPELVLPTPEPTAVPAPTATIPPERIEQTDECVTVVDPDAGDTQR